MGIFSFMHPWLLAGFALLAIPILIHFLNRLRFKKVRWAAMEFLLESQRRNRRRLWWEQLLLLLLRCATVAALVVIVARPITSDQWGELFGSTPRKEYLILLDDSYSMNQSTEDRSAFGAAKNFIARFANQQVAESAGSMLTILRASDLSTPLVPRSPLDEIFTRQWQTNKQAEVPSFLALSPYDPLFSEAPSIRQAMNEHPQILLLTDFQQKDWQKSDSIERLKKLASDTGSMIDIIDCGTEGPINLGITSLEPLTATAAVNVPLRIRFTVRNFSDVPRSRVVVTPRIDGVVATASIIESIPARDNVTGSFEILLTTPGSHDVEVRLDEDALPTDNVRYLSIDIPESIPVLIVDGSEARRHSSYLSLALAPGGPAVTGLQPEILSPDQVKPTDFSRFRTAFLLDVPQLKDDVARALEHFVEQGGGLALFAGPHVETDWYNKTLYAQDHSLLPAPLASSRRMEPGSSSDQPDFKPEDHSIFETFKGERSSFLDTIAIDTWTGIDESRLAKKAKVIARHRDRSPLFIENTYGRGRVMLVLTTAGDEWTSWPQNPTYVVTNLLLHEYLSQPASPASAPLVGQKWDLEWDVARFRPAVELTHPAIPPDPPLIDKLEASIKDDVCRLAIGPMERPGIYRLGRIRFDSSPESIARAFNVDSREGDLQTADREQVMADLGDIVRYSRAESFVGQTKESATGLNTLLVMALAVLLVGEQLLAYRLSFHR